MYAIILVLLALGLASSTLASDIRGGFDREMQVYRQELRIDALKNRINIEGTLSCADAANGCGLRITENQTGKLYNLENEKSAMRLYLDGKTNVAIEGTKVGGGVSIRIKKVSAL